MRWAGDDAGGTFIQVWNELVEYEYVVPEDGGRWGWYSLPAYSPRV